MLQREATTILWYYTGDPHKLLTEFNHEILGKCKINYFNYENRENTIRIHFKICISSHTEQEPLPTNIPCSNCNTISPSVRFMCTTLSSLSKNRNAVELQIFHAEQGSEKDRNLVIACVLPLSVCACTVRIDRTFCDKCKPCPTEL